MVKLGGKVRIILHEDEEINVQDRSEKQKRENRKVQKSVILLLVKLYLI